MFVSGRQMSEGSKCPTFAAGSYAYISAPRLLLLRLLRLAVTSAFPRQRLVLQSTTITNLSTAVQSTYTETGCHHAECRTNALPRIENYHRGHLLAGPNDNTSPINPNSYPIL